MFYILDCFSKLQDQILFTKVSSFRVPNLGNEAERNDADGYHMVAFSYGASSESTDQKNTDTESSFQPPFSVPEQLMQNLPPTEKVHQIIARTAMFVSKHGGQSEIILRVKQGDNPTFGFLMPDHNLHPYFRFLVDHQELLKSDIDGKSIEDENKIESGDQMGGALSLLGSVYGSGEDEEGAHEDAPAFTKNDFEESVNAADNATISHGSEQNNPSLNAAGKDDSVSKPPFSSLKERSHVVKRNRSISTVKVGTTTGVKRDGDSTTSVSSAVDKLQPFISHSLSKVEPSILEPPADLKRVVDKIVEFILRNGKEFESVLVQQDTKHGRFPFLLPTNQYHPYYLKALQKAQESKLAGKSFISEKLDSLGHGMDRKTGTKESDALSLASDIPYESDRKEKFKMVIGKSKKDGQDPPSKITQPQVGVSVDAAAAILQAATKGIKNPNLEMLSKTISGIGHGPSSEAGDSLLSSCPQSSNQKSDKIWEHGVSIPVAKAIAKTMAVAAASEADSSEARLTREQKLKAERLKRAKMFAAMIKGGAAPLKSEPLRGLSVEPSESGLSGSDSHALHPTAQERESKIPLEIDTHNRIEKSADEYNERRSKRSYRSRSKRAEDEDEEEEELKDNRDHKHSRKKRRSHRSSHRSRDRHKRRKRHSSSQDGESQHQHKSSSSLDEHQHKQDSSSEDGYRRSRHKHKHDSSSDDEHRHSRRKHGHDSSSDDEHRHSRRKHGHDSSPDDEYRRSRRRRKHDSSSDEYTYSRHGQRHDSDDEHQNCRHQHKHASSSNDESQRRSRSVKHRKSSRTERETDLEEGEIITKSDQSKVSEGGDGASREASVDISKSYQEVRASSQHSESTEVSNDLRAKIRAMLMATL
ncbi:uncharacterized protein LOC110670025 isoform X2 [Hevea brasiliensis]|uniref:uncharacterized protein LOC110670025 isoform X2 n=1 Tax=Hevea brasiliensis TaxID=3981 RepID=UPI000B7721F9|nr:uncharacterized protein LOC110670025 isoform X2 [Hevea brasiliensis]